MAATNTDIVCSVCEAHHITKCADHWCPECEQGLCSNCQSHHRILKASKDHSVIPAESYKKLPPLISKITSYCQDHDMKYTNFCQKHNTFSCPVCISSSHKDCLGCMIPLQEVVKASKTSSMMENVEQSCKDLKQNINKIIEDRKQNLSKVKDQRQKIQTEIQELRLTINSHLDRLERDTITQLVAVENETGSKMEALLTQLSAECSIVDELHSDILVVKEHASDLQTFLGLKAMEAKIEEKEIFIKSLTENENLQSLNLMCRINEKLFDIMTSITIFGSVSIDTSPASINLTNEKEKQAQIMAVTIPPCPLSINDITLTFHSTIAIPTSIFGNHFKGCCVCPNMKMVFADCKNDKLFILNEDFSLRKEIRCLHSVNGPIDVTSIDENTVAVTTCYSIKIINIETERIERTIPTEGCWSCGITYHNGALLWCAQSKGIQMLQLTDHSNESITTLVEQNTLGQWSYITACGDKIYQTNYCRNLVTCFSIRGMKLWEYKDFINPTGVTVDNNNNIYITLRWTDNIMVLSPDGTLSRKLLGREHV